MASDGFFARSVKVLKTITQPPQEPNPPDEAPLPPPPERTPLNQRSPFTIGLYAAFGAFAAWGVLNAVTQLRGVLVLIFLSLFLALGLNPSVERLHRRGVPRPAAVTIVAVLVLGAVALAIGSLLPVLTTQIQVLVTNSPYYLQALRENPQIAQWDSEYKIIDRVTQFVTSGQWFSTLFGGILDASKALAGTVFNTIMTLVLTLYFLASLPSFKNVIYRLAPASRRPRVRYLANEMFSRVGGYMTGLFLVVLCASSVAFVFMNIVGLGQYSLALAVVVAMFAFIPLVGSTCSMVIVSTVAFSHSSTMGIITLLFFLTYQQIDTYLIQPRIFASSVNVPGIVVIVAALSGGILLGVVGAFMAIPTAAVLLLLYREVLMPYLDRI